MTDLIAKIFYLICWLMLLIPIGICIIIVLIKNSDAIPALVVVGPIWFIVTFGPPFIIIIR